VSSSRSETVEALERGLRVIEAFNEVDSELTLSEVARKTALKPATARRSLLTLEKLGHVQCIKGRYFLSARVLALGSAYLRSSNVEGLLLPTLRRLVDEFGDSAGIAVRVDTNVLYVAHYFMPGSIRQIAGTGVSYPAHLTSMGRILLADLPEGALDRWLSRSPMIRYTEFTVTDPRRFRAALKIVRSKGYATIRDELFLGVTALAVPIVDSSGRAVAALNTSAYSGQFTERRLVQDRLASLKKASKEISELVVRHPTLLNSFYTDQNRIFVAAPPSRGPQRRAGIMLR
jgi:IclR family pca regulon transcriptional regulator